MKFVIIRCVPILIALSLGVLSAYAQKESDIVNKLRIALRDGALEKPEPSLAGKGIFNMQDMSFSGAMYYQYPISRMEMSIQGATFIRFDNDTLDWEYNPFEKQHYIRWKNTESRKHEMDLSKVLDFSSRPLLFYKKLKHQLKLKPEQKVDSVEAYVLELHMKESSIAPVIFYINKRTNLIYKTQSGDNVRWYANYRHIGNYMYPAFMAYSDPSGSTMTLNFDELIVGKPIADSLLVIPQEAFDNHEKREKAISRTIAEADSLLNEGKYDAAMNRYNEVLKLDANNYNAYNGRGLVRIYTKKYYEAIGDLNTALEIDPQGSRAYNNRGLAKFYLGDKQSALSDYTEALKLDSNMFIAYKNRGLLYLRDSRYTEGAADFTKAMMLRPEDGDAHFKFGVAIAQLGRYEEALASYTKATSLDYLTEELYNYRGVTEYKLKKYSEATESFREAMKKNAENLQYVDNLGNALYRLQKYSEAEAVFEAYLKKSNKNADIYNMLGLCKYQEEEYKGAIANFTKAIEVNGKVAVFFENRGDAKSQLEDYTGAIADYTLSISVNPNDAELFFKRGMMKIRSSKKLEGCQDLGTAHDMKFEDAKDAIIKNCN